MPLQERKLTGLKKRQQIENASRTMFIWVAIASIAVSVCVTTVQYLFQKWSYNNRVIAAKSLAANTLRSNISSAQKLKENVDALVGNQDLASVKIKQEDPNTKSVLDALPSVLDAPALATSLQQAIVNRSGVVIENITVAQATQTTDASANDSKPVEIPFNITVSGSYDKIRTMVLDLERTIRPMKLVTINLTGDDASMRATIDAVTYYQPAKTTDAKEEVVQ